MIINCKEISKIAALISPQETEKIKKHVKNATADFCARYYDEIYYERWFSLDMIFSEEDYYKQPSLNAVYDYYVNIGKNGKDAAVFARLDLNCLLEEILSSDKRVFTKNVYDKKSFLPSYMMISL